MSALIAVFVLILQATAAAAHGNESHASISWTFDPWIMVPLVAVALLYALGSIRMSRRRRGMSHWMIRSGVLFWTGLAALAAALVSPLHELGEHLFSVFAGRWGAVNVTAVSFITATGFVHMKVDSQRYEESRARFGNVSPDDERRRLRAAAPSRPVACRDPPSRRGRSADPRARDDGQPD